MNKCNRQLHTYLMKDLANVAHILLQGAFWYDKCGSANLNGVLDTGEESGRSFKWQSVTWYSWYNDLRPMKSVQMKIRPVEY